MPTRPLPSLPYRLQAFYRHAHRTTLAWELNVNMVYCIALSGNATNRARNEELAKAVEYRAPVAHYSDQADALPLGHGGESTPPPDQ